MTERALRLAFAGTPEFAATILSGLLAVGRYPLSHVYTQPDRRAGRGRTIRKSPVKRLAEMHGLRILQPAAPTEIDSDGSLSGIDALIVAAYGLLLPSAILTRPRLGCLNVHPSLLPRWRGAAPIPRAIEAGDEVTGVSIMRMNAGLDTGDVLLQQSCPIRDDDTAGSLGERLAALGTRCLIDALDALAHGRESPLRQDDSRATYARKLSKQELRIDWSRPASAIERSIRAFNPEPLAHATLEGIEVLVWNATAVSCDRSAAPGSVVSADETGIGVMTGSGVLRITRLQLPGKKPISALDFVNARPGWKRGQRAPGARA